MSSDEESTTCEENDHQVKFVEVLQNYKVVLEKSQVPTIKKEKETALMNLQAEWQALTGKAISIKQLAKKINNMKTKIKQKADIKRTGNKQIKLKSWEQAFWKLMDGDRNPALCKKPGAVQVGAPPPIEKTVSVNISSEYTTPVQSVQVPQTAKNTVSKKIKKNSLPETKETQNLSTAELQRLVLLEQLEVLRLKKRKLIRELEQEQLLVPENDKLYTQL